ncbi:putative AMP-binding enzyme [Algoriphagus machipongonensis]|uniref:AMP-binding enzyme n=1 Tax=Algoriphagus machipongonensis TaxID=388413 RepID=E2RUF8_9BACT|nr:putative AMP-binding enzyme [Algoriphagus machipongonensis]
MLNSRINNSSLQASKSTISSLTGSQQSIWASHKIDPHSTSNYLPHTFKLRGEIDIYAFEQAFNKLISNNDSLRTIFQENEELEVEQIVLQEMDFTLESIHVSETEVNSFIDHRILQPIDLHQRCFDSTLIKLGEEHFIWYLSVHHILADAASIKILFEEMAKLYQAELSHQKIEFEKKSSFEKYREFELEKRNSKNTPSAEYWKSKGQIPDKKLALYGNEKSSKSKARRVKIPIDRALKDSLDEKLNTGGYRSFNPDLTKFTIWSTLFAAFISRISGESNIRLGSPFPNRNLSDFKNTTGLLIEVLPFDIQVTSEDTFQSLFGKVRLELFDFFKNGYPGAQTMENARGIHLVVNYIPICFGDFGTIPCKTKWLFPGELDPGHQLRLQAFDFNNQTNLDYYFDVNEAYFTDSQIELLPDHFTKLVQAFISDDGSKISDVKLVTDQEKAELINTYESSENTILSLDNQLKNIFEQNSNNRALALGEESISFRELDILINKTCLKLLEQGVKPQNVVVVHKERSAEYIISILAILRLGATFVPLPVGLPQKRIQVILEDLKPKLLISASSDFGSNYATSDINLQELRSSENQKAELELGIDQNRSTYILFTSGSTGKPKGVEVSLLSLANYIQEAKNLYSKGQEVSMPFFTSIGFDLTITSIFLPLLTGGSIHIYPESKGTSDLSILEVVKNKQINAIKLTPSHARVIQGSELKDSQLHTVIFGGENLETNLALDFQSQLPEAAEIFNEYGPTEATVGCIVHKFDPNEKAFSVPIGKPISDCYFYVLDERLNPVPQGVPGNLYLGGKVLALGYYQNQNLTDESFINNPYQDGQKIYKSGDLARLNAHGNLEYLGRADEQIKLNGVRIESTELELLISKFPSVEETHIVLADSQEDLFEVPDFYCKNCGIPSTYPDASFNEEGVCNLCESFEEYQSNVSTYFKSFDNLKSEILGLGEEKEKEYDCLMLLSGGKDSSYALAKLVELGLNVLAWTLDNDFISDNAKENINNTTSKLGVDHIYGRTDAMNAIFRDSLERHQNVCNGCFKTVYTLSTKLALEKHIPVIVTGLSRGQFFETRLTEELFLKDHFDPADIDNIILETRKSYHRSKDAVSEYLDVSMFETDEVFSKVSFVDFYRFSDVSLSEMIDYLENKIGWKRPKDTGRSTNCIINDLGIYVHKRKKGYHNYAFPYSWDVRVGHKKREETIDELNDELSENAIKELMQEIGMESQGPSKEIRAYFKASSQVNKNELIAYLREFLPSNMIPSIYIQIDSFPLTANGKVDKQALLRSQTKSAPQKNKAIVKPKNKIEELVHSTWCSVLKMDSIDVTDSFIPLGGNSLSAIRIVSLLSKRLNLEISIQEFFEQDSIRKLSASIEAEIKKRMGIH